MNAAGPGPAGFGGQVAGPEGAPGIVLVHGTRMAGAFWRPQTEALSDRFRVIAVDLPGHGRRRAEPFTHAEALRTISAAAASCAGGTAVVVGHSLGGFLSMDAALAAPGRVEGLVLAGCSVDASGALTLPYRLLARLLPLFAEARLTRWNDRLLRRRYSPEVTAAQREAGYGFAATPAALRSVFGRDHAGALATYPGPVLVLNGERDRAFRSGERRFLARCPRARLALLPGAGHLSSWDQPAAFTAAVRAFAGEVTGARLASPAPVRSR